MGLLVVISSPSGGGKDAVINGLLKLLPNAVRLVTTTSRPPRPGNRDGVDYHFVSREAFEQKIAAGEMVEYNRYTDHYYGIEKKWLDTTVAEHEIVLVQIEVNGKHNLDRQHIPHISVFLLPENLDLLRARLAGRGGLDEMEINERLRIAGTEIAASTDYQYRLVNKNGQLAETVATIANIIDQELKK